FGLGIGIPATNLWIAETSGANRAAALNLINLAWGIGAVALPAVVAIAVRAAHLRWVFSVIAVASLGLALASFTARAEAAAVAAGPRVAGPLFAWAGLGGASLPWLVGFVSQRGAGLRSGLAVPLVAVVLMGVVLMGAVLLGARAVTPAGR